MRMLWLKLAATVASMIAGGCMSPITKDVVDDDLDINIDPNPQPKESNEGIFVTASQDAFSEIKTWLGTENSITVAKPMKVERPEVTVNIPSGANVSYIFSESEGTFVFTAPKPTVEAKVLGWTVRPTLSQVILRPAGDGTAKTSLGAYKFKWLADEEDSGAAAATDKELPEVWCYSMPGCVPCVRARLELAAEKELPFKVIWKDEVAPTWLETRPGFWWHVTKDQPSQADVNNTRQTTGWNGVKDFVERWKASRSPKKFQRSFQEGQAANSSAQPDLNIGSRSVAHWSINGTFTPSRSTLLSHLSNDGIHRGRHDWQMLNSLTTEQLRWLHDRDHEGSSVRVNAGQSRQFLWWSY